MVISLSYWISMAIIFCLWSSARSELCSEDEEPHVHQMSLLQHGLELGAAAGERHLQVRHAHNEASRQAQPHHETLELNGQVKKALVLVCVAVLTAQLLLVGRMVCMPSVPLPSKEDEDEAEEITADDLLPSTEDKSIGHVLLSVLIWAGLGLALIHFNTYIALDPSEGGLGFPFPMALTLWHLFASLVAISTVYCVRPRLMPQVHVQEALCRTGRRRGGLDFVTVVMYIGICNALYLTLINMAYLQFQAPFIDMLKSCDPVVVYCISVAAGLESLRIAPGVALGIVALGVAGSSYGLMKFSWLGFGLVLTSLILDGMRLVLMKISMSSKGFKLDPLASLYFYSLVGVMALCGPVVYFEGHGLLAVLGTASAKFCWVLVLYAVVGFVHNLSLFFLIANTSPTTISVARVIRDVILTFSAASFLHTTLTRAKVLGYLCACLGVKLWDEVKARPGAFDEAFGLKTGDLAQSPEACKVEARRALQAAPEVQSFDMAHGDSESESCSSQASDAQKPSDERGMEDDALAEKLSNMFLLSKVQNHAW